MHLGKVTYQNQTELSFVLFSVSWMGHREMPTYPGLAVHF